ncbi:MAG: hypothetical protein GY804_01820 [Alphaproteobacteria bacterium]|nr:hypothetical protein [Alphaproteobacteria bacterium]
MSSIEKQKVADKLNEVGASRPCARCGGEKFHLLDDYADIMIQKQFGVTNVGGATIPVINIVCTKCGAITQHVIGALGLLPEQAKGGGDDK